MARSPGLGRGLSALLGDAEPAPVKPAPAPAPTPVAVKPTPVPAAAANDGGPKYVPIELLRRNPQQPRRHFEDAEISELAA